MKKSRIWYDRSFSSVLLVATLVCLVLKTSAAQATPLQAEKVPLAFSQQGHCSWDVILDAFAGKSGITGGLVAVSALSSHVAWAVGRVYNQVAVLQWNGGQRWHFNNVPYPGFLLGVAALSNKDAWAVGNGGIHGTLIEHWNGTRWHIVPSHGSPQGGLNGVAVISANDAWAVGNGSGNKTLIEHWDGLHWHIVPSPAAGSLSGVTAVSANDIWAVGRSNGPGTLIEHWDGSQWRVIPQTGKGNLMAVGADSANDVWADGSNRNGTVVEHWDGQKWQVVSSPNPYGASLNGIAVISPNDVWAVGSYINRSIIPPGPIEQLSMQWNGKNWKQILGHSPNGGRSVFYSAAPVPGTTDVLAVGFSVDTSPERDYFLLAELYSCS